MNPDDSLEKCPRLYENEPSIPVVSFFTASILTVVSFIVVPIAAAGAISGYYK